MVKLLLLVRADLIKYWQILHGDGDLCNIFSLAPRVGTRGHPLKLVVPRRGCDARGRFFSVRCVCLWNSLPASIVMLTSLPAFKKALAEYMHDEFFRYD